MKTKYEIARLILHVLLYISWYVRFTRSRKASRVNWYLLKFGTTDICNSRVDFSSDGSSQTRWVVMTHQHFQVVSPPPLCSHVHDFFSHQLTFLTVGSTFQVMARYELDRWPHHLHCLQKTISCYLTFLLLDGSSSPESRPNSICVYWTTLSIWAKSMFCLSYPSSVG